MARPLAPAVAVPVETVHLFRLQQRRVVARQWNPEPDTLASCLRPRDLFGDQAQRRFAFLANEQRRGMIVEGQRSDAVQDLVEEILGADLFHNFLVDPGAYFEEPIAIDSVNGGSQD